MKDRDAARSRDLTRPDRAPRWAKVGERNPHWRIDPRTDPDYPPRGESEAEGVEALIREVAGAFRRPAVAAADRRGRPLPRCGKTGRFAVAAAAPGPNAERDVTLYLVSEAFGLTLKELVADPRFGLSCRGVASRRRRAGAALVRERRSRNEPAW